MLLHKVGKNSRAFNLNTINILAWKYCNVHYFLRKPLCDVLSCAWHISPINTQKMKRKLHFYLKHFVGGGFIHYCSIFGGCQNSNSPTVIWLQSQCQNFVVYLLLLRVCSYTWNSACRIESAATVYNIQW